MSDGSPPASLRHELRTPLNHIIAYSELLAEEAEDRGQSSLVPDLHKIRSAAWSLLAMIEQHLGTSAPAASEPADRPPLPESPAPALAKPGAAETATLLVVDDNELNRDALSRRLQAHGYQVRQAAGGREALDRVAGEAVDLILLDVLMPDISGLSVLQMLRAAHSVSELPVIMVTALDQSEDTALALRLGANDYVTKPLDFVVVLARIETQLSLKRATQQVAALAAQLEERNAFIRAAFDRYVDPEVVENLLETPDGLRLGGERREVTILMSDLRGFTTITQRLAPEQVVRLLNRYLGGMAEVITRFGGTIDEFIGDAVLAYFGAPVRRGDDARRALACAVEMQLAMEEINRQNQREGLPEVEMGIGVDTGEVVVGSIGSHTRAKYSAIGNSVNLAARIEAATVGGQVLISDSARLAAGSDVAVDGRTLLQAKGYHEPIAVYSLRGLGGRHGVYLPRRALVLRPLEREIEVRCALVEGKQVQGAGFGGRLRALALEGAELATEQALDLLANLRLTLIGYDGEEIAGDVYAKVVEEGRIRFTALPPDAEAFLKLALKRRTAAP